MDVDLLATCWTTAGDARPLRGNDRSPFPLAARIAADKSKYGLTPGADSKQLALAAGKAERQLALSQAQERAAAAANELAVAKFALKPNDAKSKDAVASVWFRAAVGDKIEAQADGSFQVDQRVNFKLTGGETVVRKSAGKSEPACSLPR